MTLVDSVCKQIVIQHHAHVYPFAAIIRYSQLHENNVSLMITLLALFYSVIRHLETLSGLIPLPNVSLQVEYNTRRFFCQQSTWISLMRNDASDSDILPTDI
mmetsp:Transcript_6951/g.10421  ORF Transcript_6951/g.10421 Transcript_6951/m.10421 type:complete len:102 (+) Transcript_6951:78-383(+)